MCGYRSPQTNAMLRHRSAGVARFSQHMLGRAMDFYIPGVPLEEMRDIGLRLARGGVGFYPTSGSPFVHMDTGGVRMWPRMTREQLVRVFPDGKTVQIPTDGKPLPGYALALADIQKRGNNPSENSVDAARNAGVDVDTMVASNDHHSANPFAKLLGLRKDEEDDDADSYAPAAAPAPAATTRTKVKAVAVAAVERVKAVATHVAAQTKLIRTNSFAVAAATPAAQKSAPPPPTDDRLHRSRQTKSSSRAATGRARRTAPPRSLRRSARAALKWQAPIPTRPAPSARCRARPTTASRRNSRSPMPNRPAAIRRPAPLRWRRAPPWTKPARSSARARPRSQ